MNTSGMSDSDLLKVLMYEEKIKTGKSLGLRIGFSETSATTGISAIINGRNKITPGQYLNIIHEFPDFAERHNLTQKNPDNEAAESNENYYKITIITKKMNSLEIQLNYLMADMHDLKAEVKKLKSEQEKLLTEVNKKPAGENSDQSTKIA